MEDFANPNHNERYNSVMANFGMHNMQSFATAPGIFGELKTFLDLDMGLFLPFEVDDYYGLGEVVDASPPPSSSLYNVLGEPVMDTEMHAVDNNALVRTDTHNVISNYVVEYPESPNGVPDVEEPLPYSNANFNVNINLTVNINVNVEYPCCFRSEDPQNEPKVEEVFTQNAWEAGQNQQKCMKGKEKVLENYAFNKDGLLSKEAIHIDSGRLTAVSKSFGKSEINLEAEIFEGIFAKDVLNCAVRGTLDTLLSNVNPPKSKFKGIKIVDKEIQAEHFWSSTQRDLMDSDDALVERALYDQAVMGRMDSMSQV